MVRYYINTAQELEFYNELMKITTDSQQKQDIRSLYIP